MRPLLLVHGFMGGSAQWSGVDWPGEVIAPDLAGYGGAADRAAPARIEDHARGLLADLDARGIGAVDLLGHSMGGMVAQEIVAMAPERVSRLVLYATGAVGSLPGRFETIAESKRRAEAEGPGVTARRIAATWFLAREASPAYPACAAIAERASAQAIAAGLDAMAAWSGEAGLAAIGCPTLILWGDGDRTYAWRETERLWRAIPGARLAVVPGAAHAVHLEKPRVFAAILEDFLASAEPARA